MPEVNVKYRNSYRQQKALLTMGGQPFRDLGAAVAVEERAFPAALSRINYSFYKSPAEVGAWLAAHDAGLQCVVSECIACRRRVDFGHAQSPGLTDYPDDRDVIEFLTTSCL
jgi:acyl-coA reductase (luxC)